MRLTTQLLRDGYRLVRPVLFRFDPEQIHVTMIDALGALPARDHGFEASPVTVAGIRFPNRVGVAAGLDKDGIAARAWAHFGFGFAELGTVTAQPQPGNEQPRLFRAVHSHAIVNRMGFNNHGAADLVQQLRGFGVRRGNNAVGIPLGISIGKTKTVAVDDAVDDYLASLELVAPFADYVAVNVSSPNTPHLRTLQTTTNIERLVTALVERSSELGEVPVFVKLAPDLDAAQLKETLRAVSSSGASGVIACNTTITREGLAEADARYASEQGGLSGAPLTAKALRFVEQVATSTELPVIGVGGIMRPIDAQQMFEAGAQLIQLYTGFIYEGPALVRAIHEWGVA